MSLFQDNTKLFSWAVEHGFDPSKVPASDPYNWVIAALHPASPNIGPVTGIPDMDTQPTMMMNWRQTNAILPPSGLTTADTWDLEVVHIPGPGVFAVYRRRKSTGSWEYGYITNDQYRWDGTQPTYAPSGEFSSLGNPGTWPQEVTQYRLAYAGFTGVLNAASMTDQGMMVGCQMQSPWFLSGLSTVPKPPSATNSAPAFETFWENEYINYTNGGSGMPGYDQIFAISPVAEQWRARDGYYIPIRFKDGNFHWQSGQKMLATVANPWSVGSQVNGMIPTVTPPFGNGSVGLACFRGLAPTTTLSTTARVGYEICINSNSNFKPFVTRSCAPDMIAIQEYFKLSSQLGDIYPSSFNDNDILSAILTELAAVLPPPFDTILPLIGKWGGSKVLGKMRKRGPKGKQSETEKIAAAMSEPQDLDSQTPKAKKMGPQVVRKGLNAVTSLIPGGRMVKKGVGAVGKLVKRK